MHRRSPRRKAVPQHLSPSKSRNDWPKPPSSLKLTVRERELWYDGDTKTFRTVEEYSGAHVEAASTSAADILQLATTMEEVMVVLDESGIRVSPDMYKIRLPPYFCCILRDYLEASGLNVLFHHCISNNPRSFLSDATFTRARWHVKRKPFVGSESDMFWVSPSDYKLHQEVLKHLGSAGFDVVLRAISNIDHNSARDWSIFQFSFIVVSTCRSTSFHIDFHDSLAGVAWHVMIPLRLVPDSPPELVVRPEGPDGRLSHVKYEMGLAHIWGSLTDHSTAICSYVSGYRVCLSVSVGSISVSNVKRFLSDISQQYPPRNPSLLLDWAKTPHFSRRGKCSLPRFSHEAVLGLEWVTQYNIFLTLQRSSTDLELYPASVRKWITHQRYCFSTKHNGSTPDGHDFNSSHVRSARRTLTFFREFMLREINFVFSVDRDNGLNQCHWQKRYNELKEFVKKNGHCKLTYKVNPKLYGWLRTQKYNLSSVRALSASKKHRLHLMQQLGYNF